MKKTNKEKNKQYKSIPNTEIIKKLKWKSNLGY